MRLARDDSQFQIVAIAIFLTILLLCVDMQVPSSEKIERKQCCKSYCSYVDVSKGRGGHYKNATSGIGVSEKKN